MRRFAWVAALALLSCAKGGTYVLVTVGSGTPFMLTSLTVTVTNAGQSTTVPVTTGAAFTIPPTQSFVLQLGSDRSGDVTVDVQAIGSSGEVAHAKGSVPLVPAGRTTLDLMLTPEIADMSPPDIAPTDMAKVIGFAPAVTYSLTGDTCIAIADFNNDGKPDLAVAHNFGDGGSGDIVILFGAGDGTFQAGAPIPGSGGQSIVAADFDADGKQDLASPNYTGNLLRVLLGNGDGTFRMPVDYPVGVQPISVAAGDFNGDTRPDLAVANYGAATVSVLLGVGDGTFHPAVNHGADSGSDWVAVGDFNKDNREDLVLANLASFSILLGNGDGTFKAALNDSSARGYQTAVLDLNRDGRQDLAIAALDHFFVVKGNGDGTFAAATAQVTPAKGLGAADFNSDGVPDIAVTDGANGIVGVMQGKGDGTFHPPINFAVGMDAGFVGVGDFNRDGKPDLALGYNGGVGILLNTSQ